MRDIEERDYENVRGVSESALDVCRLEAIKPVSMFYQSGYLTIKEVKGAYFTLGVPNEEVRIDLNSLLLQYAAKEEGDPIRDAAGFALQEADFETFFAQVRALFAHLPYGSIETRVSESAYQRILYVLLSACPFRVTAEDRQAQGRADIVVESDDRVFIFELKVDKTAAEAIAQIRERGYAEPYRALGKPIHLIGLNFKSASHSLPRSKRSPKHREDTKARKGLGTSPFGPAGLTTVPIPCSSESSEMDDKEKAPRGGAFLRLGGA